MKCIVPVDVTPSILTSSNVAETDYAAYNSGTSYTTGQRVIYNHHIWEALASVSGVTPGTETTLPFKWQDNGATNRWRMFDKRAGDKWLIGMETSNADSIDVTLTPGVAVSAIGLVGLSGASVRVIVTDPTDGVVYDNTQSIVDTTCENFWQYFFKPFERVEQVALFDLPAYTSATIRVIITYTSDTARCGMLVIGQPYSLDWAVYGTGIGFDSYSKTETDDFGNVSIVPRGSSDYVDYAVRIETPRLNGVKNTLKRLKDKPTIFSGEDDYSGVTITMGLYEKFYAVLSTPAVSEMNLKVRSLQ